MSEVFLFVRCCFFGVFKVVKQSLVRSVVGSRDKNISQELFFIFRITIEGSQSIDKGIDSFIAELITATNSDDFGFLTNRLSY